jgi:hypothetical protein
MAPFMTNRREPLETFQVLGQDPCWEGRGRHVSDGPPVTTRDFPLSPDRVYRYGKCGQIAPV